jgi:hypothetical protein
MAARHASTLIAMLALVLGGCTGSSQQEVTLFGSNQDAVPVGGCDAPPNPGYVTIHRLNRTEYNNTVRDLLGVTTRPADSFPADEVAAGFENNSAVLTVSPALLDHWESTAEKLGADAVSAGIIRCDAATVGKEACARQTLEPFLLRAWRRPATDEEIGRLLSLLAVAEGQGDSFQTGVALMLKSALLSPNFVYRGEGAVEAEPSRALSGYEVASRLSYFLWSSMPDEALLEAAAANQLAEPQQIEAQVDRMLADPKAASLLDALALNWLPGRGVQLMAPDPVAYPFDDELRAGLLDETRHFFKAFIDENLPMSDLLDTRFSFLNERVAKHYGVPGVTGPAFRKVDLSNFPQRGGLLTQGTFLAGTSRSVDTSVVARGLWVLTNILCSSPPPPPGDVDTKKGEVDPAASKREQMAQHRSDPSCAACHAAIDPIGFGLENYDIIGAWRTQIGAFPIDASGVLVGGASFSGPREMFAALKKDPRVNQCLAQTLFTYALGRTMTTVESCTVKNAALTVQERGGGFKDLLHTLTTSKPFRFQGADLQGTEGNAP